MHDELCPVYLLARPKHLDKLDALTNLLLESSAVAF